MLRKLFFVPGLIISLTSHLYAQEKMPVTFGHVSKNDFDISSLKVDTTNGAVIIADVGYSSFVGNDKGWFSLVYKHQARIRVINKNGFDLANVEVYLYKNGESVEKLRDVKGSSYNIENGQVVETKLSKDAIFEDKYDKKHIIKKFTLPAVKAGSIIEYSYSVYSDFLFNLQPWSFQGAYPVVWSEYEASIPEFFKYVFLSQGYLAFSKEESYGREPFTIRESDNTAYGKSDVITVTSNTTHTKWVMKDLPALKEEKFTSSINNHIAKIEFQLSGIQLPDEPYENVMGDWPKATKDLLEREDFGVDINKSNGWLNDVIKDITAGAATPKDKARKIYYYVKNNIKSTDERGILADKSIKEVFKTKNGSIAEINMLLIAMLRHEDITADPVILSTKNNGITYELYPTINRYNYLICRAVIDTATFFLDASQSYLGFGKLPLYCYNGHARIVDTSALPVYFSPDTLQQKKITSIFLFSDSAMHGKWTGKTNSKLTYQESCDMREKIADNGKESIEKSLKASFAEDISLSEIAFNSLNDCEKAIGLNYSLTIDDNNVSGGLIYFNPIITDAYKENPLKSVERKYPVEMPYLSDEQYNLSLEIPDGYEVDELPKPAKVTFNESDALFEYSVANDGLIITITSHLKFEKATFDPADYENLRSFFDYVVKKDNEQIVFRKKK